MTDGPPPIEPSQKVTPEEQIRILETIAREGSDSNRIQAIKELRRLQGDGDDHHDDEDEFEKLIQKK